MMDFLGWFRGIALGQSEEENVTSIAATIEEWVGKIMRLRQRDYPSQRCQMLDLLGCVRGIALGQPEEDAR